MNLKKTMAGIMACVLVGGAMPAYGTAIPELAMKVNAADTSEKMTAEEFLKSGTNASCANVYTSSLEDDSFKMNGRTYYQGVKFTGKNSYGTNQAEISFNTENVNTISCVWGHIDNAKMENATVSVYLDDVLTDKIPLTEYMPVTEYTFDVSGASVLRISLDITANAQYAMAEVEVDGVSAKELHNTPEYETLDLFTHSGYNIVRAEPFEAKSQLESKRVNGRYYYQGVIFTGGLSYSKTTETITYNTENVNTISCTWGHIDNTKMNNATVSVYLDGVLMDKVPLSATMEPTAFKCDVSEASEVRFDVEIENDAKFAMLDMTVDGKSPQKTYTIPEYSTAELFIDDSFNAVRASVHDVVSPLEAYKVIGRNYYQGIVFKGANSYSVNTAELTYNVENVDSISCTWGHVDNTKMTNAVVSVYLDNVLTDKFELSAYMLPKPYTLDVSDAAKVCFSVDVDEDANYIMGDIKVDASETKRPVSVPKYTSGKEFSEAGFNKKNFVVYDAASDLDAFAINGKIYRQGVVFKGANTYSTTKAEVTYNVENTNTVSFKWGHVDNTKEENAEVNIYLDGQLQKPVTLTPDMDLKEQIIDVSEASTLTIASMINRDAQYAMVDIEISDEKVPEPVIPLGDINGDGKIDSNDATAILIEYSESSTGGESTLTDDQKTAADVDKNGKIDSTDATFILQFYGEVSTGGKETDMSKWMENK